MTAIKDITGQRFGRLVATRFVELQGPEGRGRAAWEYACDCGERFVTLAQSVKAKWHSGNCPECVRLSKAARTYVHGGTGTRLHRIWIGIRQRCNNANDTGFADYGGRGIGVSPLWGEFPAFREWSLANGYHDDLELDRIDNNGPYAPGNCRWVDHATNVRNTRRTRMVDYRGRRVCITQLAKETGVHLSTLRQRINAGMTPEQAVDAPPNETMLSWRGQRLSISQLAQQTGIPKTTLVGRIKRQGMGVEQAVTLPRDTWATRRLRSPGR